MIYLLAFVSFAIVEIIALIKTKRMYGEVGQEVDSLTAKQTVCTTK